MTTPTMEDIETMMSDERINEDLKDACVAYLDCTGAEDLSDFEESYLGTWSSDEAFAQDTADDLGNDNKNWPLYCIDWEYAASELMMDHSEQDGFYFRNI